MKILIAEDDKAHQKINEILMEDWEFEFDMISSGRKAFDLAKANEGEYDLCLMDIDLPGMNGWDAAKLIRQELKYLPIVALTANPWFNDKYLEIGMDDYIEKPYDIDQLYKTINEVTVKSETMIFKDNLVEIKKEMPMDQQHAQELRELKKQNLIKVKFDDISGAEVVVHKNIINKIVQDFNIKKQFVSTFLNRNPDKPTKCVLFGNNCRMPQVYLENEEYESELQKEDEEVKKCPEMILKIEDND